MEGIGKSTFASRFPDPLFIDVEGGTAQMDVRRVEKPQTWDELIAIVNEVAATPDICKTLVIDTADWAEQLCVAHICKKHKQNSLEAFPYGRGYTILSEEFARFLSACDKVINAGINVAIVAHAKIRKFEQPDEMGAYDRWELKLTRQVAPLVKEWSDLLLFANYQTVVVTSETNIKKPSGGKRVMYANHHTTLDAKNRFGLPDVMGLDFANIAHLFSKSSPAEPNPIDRLRALMAEAGITETQLRNLVAERGYYARDVPVNTYSDSFLVTCIKNFAKIVHIIKEENNNV